MSTLQNPKPQPPPLPTENAHEPTITVAPLSAADKKRADEKSIRDRFAEVLGNDVVLEGKKLVEQTISSILEKQSYFRREQLIKRTLSSAQKKVSEHILERKEFEQYIRWLVETYDFHPIGKTNCVTTHSMWGDEVKIVELAGRKNPQFKQPVDVVDAAIARKENISEEQTDAVRAATLSENAVTVIEGTAGAGKSFTMETVKEIYMAQGYKVLGLALGWSAAKVLGESAKLDDENCRAIQGVTQEWLEARDNFVDPFSGPTLIIVDEAGMVGTRHIALILEQAARSRHPVKIVLTGDSYQVNPVAAGNALELIIHHYGTTRIDTIRRQHQFTHRQAVMNFSKKKSGPALNTLMHQECLHWCKDTDMVMNMVVQDYVSYRLAHPDKKALAITLSNKEVLELNFRIRAAYKKLGLIGSEDVRLTVTNGEEMFETDFSEGDEVVLRSNDRNLMVYEIDNKKSLAKPSSWKPLRMGVFNRNSGRVVKILKSKDPLGSYDFVIDLAGDSPGRVVVNSAKFKAYGKKGMPMLHNYAGTTYGSQGQTVSQVFFIDNPMIDFRIAYVGGSRHKENIDIYLNETELHRRLDNAIGRRQGLNSYLRMQQQGKSVQDAAVALGRYTRTQMLQAVALAWGKHSEKLTGMMFEYLERTRYSNKRDSKDTVVQPTNLRDMVVDFLPEYNVRPRTVDMEKIFNLPDPIVESALVRESDAEHNKSKHNGQEMPIDPERTPLPMNEKASPQRATPGALPTSAPKERPLLKAFGWLMGKSPTPQPPPLPPNLRQEDPVGAFDVLPDNWEKSSDPSVVQKSISYINRWLNPTPHNNIPYVSGNEPCGRIEFPEFDKKIDHEQRWEGVLDPRPHYLSFDGVPSLANVEGGPDKEWLAQQKGVLWDVGRFGEPRVLARNPQGDVVARYRMNGECVVGEGQAPIIVNRATDAVGRFNKNVYIVAGAKEWMWLRETLENNNAHDPSKIPHILWAAKDVDWGVMAKHLQSMQRIVIVRSKADDRQIPWALSLQQILLERYNLETVISPAIPEQNSDVEISSKMKM